MSWLHEVNELRKRKELAAQMGGPEGIARQRKRGKLTVRERIDLLADEGSFQEVGGQTGTGTYDDDGNLTDFRPANVVMGLVELDGRSVLVNGGDFTVRGGASDGAVGDKSGHIQRMAEQWRLPYVRLLDAAGGSVRSSEKKGRTNIPGKMGSPIPDLLNIVPVVSGVLGSVAGLPAVEACMAHFNVMVKESSQVFVSGPPVVKAALGYDITKEELGGPHIQVYGSGTVDNLAETEEEAMQMIRRFLSYMPPSVWDMPSRVDPEDSPDRKDEDLLSIIPRDRTKLYDPYEILGRVLDTKSFFEIAPFYGGARITGLARVNGYPVGVMINNPNHLGGGTDVAAGDKIIRLMLLCNTFHLPMVYFADEPGFMVGLEAEKQGIVRAGARMVLAQRETIMPWITIITRQIYGVAGGCHVRPGNMYKRYAWPSGHWGSLHIKGGAMAAYRREIDEAPDPDAKRAEIEERLSAFSSPFRSAEAFDMEDIIDPRETRPLLCKFIEQAQPVLRSQLGPPNAPYRP